MTRWIYEASLLISKGTHNTVLFSENSTETPFYTHRREQTGLFERDRQPDRHVDCLHVMIIIKLDLHRSALEAEDQCRQVNLLTRASRVSRIAVGNMVPSRKLVPLSFYWDWNIPSDWSGGWWYHYEGYRRIQGPPANSKYYQQAFTNLIYFALIFHKHDFTPHHNSVLL